MNQTQELNEAIQYVIHNITFDVDIKHSTFEFTIRLLGSLLSIYELTGEKNKDLLAKAEDIGKRLSWAFNTTLGIPLKNINLKYPAKGIQMPTFVSVAEIGTLQLEFRVLSYHTSNPIYDIKATHAMAYLLSIVPSNMLPKIYFTDNKFTGPTSLFGGGDSFYEYLLKQYVLTNKTEDIYKYAYLNASNSIVKYMLKISSLPLFILFS